MHYNDLQYYSQNTEVTMKKQNLIPYFSVERPFEVVYRKSSTSTPVKPHTHNALEIYFTLTDLPDVLLNDTVSGVARGSLIIIPPHYVHQLFNQRLTIYERYIVTINSAWLNTVLTDSPELMNYAAPISLPMVISLSPQKVTLLSDILDGYIKKNSSTTMTTYTDFFSLLETLDALITEGIKKRSSGKLSISQSQKNVNEIIAYINRHITEPLTLDTIADEFYLNKDYLGRLFKEHTHATIGHYISVQRAELAGSLLAEGHTVAEVQETLGFSSYAYFFKFFKKMTGISPSQYRKKH